MQDRSKGKMKEEGEGRTRGGNRTSHPASSESENKPSRSAWRLTRKNKIKGSWWSIPVNPEAGIGRRAERRRTSSAGEGTGRRKVLGDAEKGENCPQALILSR